MRVIFQGARPTGDFEPVDEEEYKETVRLAETVVLWAERIIQQQKDNVT